MSDTGWFARLTVLQDYTTKRTEAGKAPIAFRMTGVEKVSNPELEAKFAAACMRISQLPGRDPQELRPRFGFHGVSCLVGCEF